MIPSIPETFSCTRPSAPHPVPLLSLQPFSVDPVWGSSSAGHSSSWPVAGVTTAVVQRERESSDAWSWSQPAPLKLGNRASEPVPPGGWVLAQVPVQLASGTLEHPRSVQEPAPGARRTSWVWAVLHGVLPLSQLCFCLPHLTLMLKGGTSKAVRS